MDNKDFDEVEDIFGTDVEENYDVPVFNPDSSSDDNNVEVPTYEEVKETEDVPLYDVQPEVEETPVVEEAKEESEIQVPLFDDNASFNVQQEESSFEPELSTQTDVFDVDPVALEPNYDEEPVEETYGPVQVEANYDEEVNEHPDAVVSLNNEPEEVNNTKLEDVPPVNLKDNQSLKFVFIIGIIILIAIFLLPLLNQFNI